LGICGAAVRQRTFTWPAPWSELVDLTEGDTTYSWCALAVAIQTLGAAGPTGTAAVTPSTTANTEDWNWSCIIGSNAGPGGCGVPGATNRALILGDGLKSHGRAI
jgi:hypothetical protein